MTRLGDYCVRPPPSDDVNEWQLIGPDGQPVVEANRFLHAACLRGLASHSLRAYAYDLLCAFRWMHTRGRDVAGLSVDTLLDFVEYQRQSSPAVATTINRRLAVLQWFAAFIAGKPMAISSWQPSGRVRYRRGTRRSLVKVRVGHPLIVPLTDRDVLAFVATLRTARDRAITLLMWADGLRSCEILNLGMGDVDFQNMSLKLLGKGRKERMMPLDERVAKVLLQYLAYERPARASPRFFVVLKGPRRGQSMTYTGLHRIFRYHRATSKVLNANPHRFRHTFGANMTRCRVPLAVLTKMMGHSSPKTTLRYVQLNDHDMRQQYEDALKTLNAGGILDDRLPTAVP